MTWVKLPASYYLDPRMLRVSEGAEVMYLRGLGVAWPWSLGGSDEPSNLQTLCIPCNMRKGARVS